MMMSRICLLSLFLVSLALVAGCKPSYTGKLAKPEPVIPEPLPAPRPCPDDPEPAKQPPALLCFSEPWCGPCHQEHGNQKRVASKYDGRCLVWTVSVDGEGQVSRDDAKKLFAALNIKSIPAYVLVGSDGKIRGQWTGGGHWPGIETAIDKLLLKP